MKIRAFVEGNLEEALREEGKRADVAVSAAITDATNGLKNAYRTQIKSARLGTRLANTWRGDVYQPGQIKAAGFIYSKAATIVSAYARGAQIVAKRTRWLAIPTKEAGRAGRRRITPERWMRIHKQKLFFVQISGEVARFVAPGKEKGQPDRTIFILVKQVKIAQRFDVDRPAQEWHNRLPQLILNNWPEAA
jgi:hypothetical protein